MDNLLAGSDFLLLSEESTDKTRRAQLTVFLTDSLTVPLIRHLRNLSV